MIGLTHPSNLGPNYAFSLDLIEKEIFFRYSTDICSYVYIIYSLYTYMLYVYIYIYIYIYYIYYIYIYIYTIYILEHL